MESRLTDLEIRFTHVDDSVEELTKTVLHQEQRIHALEEEFKRLKQILGEMSPSPVVAETEEVPPPHY